MTTENVLSPYDGAVVGRVEKTDLAGADLAVDTAARAFGSFASRPRFARADVLDRAASLLDERRDRFADLIAREAGKLLYDARGEVGRSVFNLRTAAAEARRFAGVEVPLDLDEAVSAYQTVPADQAASPRTTAPRDKVGLMRRRPSGPVLAITPFNFPLNLVLHKVAPALAVGAPIVLKPAPQTPLTSVALADLLTEAGLPEGVLSVVHCDVDVADAMVRDDRFSVVTFTGSAAVGWGIKAAAGRKKVLLELGGNGAVIVDHDGDVDRAVGCVIRGGMVFAGQYCIGVQRVLVHDAVHDRFVAALVDAAKAVRVGDPLESGVECGPVIDERSAIRITSWIDEATADGAVVVAGGRRSGTLVDPTVLTGTRPGMKIEDEEVFGPVVTVNPFGHLEQAITRVNTSKYGLQAAIFTSNLRSAMRAADQIEVGALIVNDSPTFRVDSMPFGGQKESGIGREGTRYAMEEMTDTRLLVMDYS